MTPSPQPSTLPQTIWAKAQTLVFIPELLFETTLGTKVYPDGTILHDLRVPLGYWEAKDTADNLDNEIAEFRAAVTQFKTDLPAVLKAPRDKIDDAYASNPSFQSAVTKFLDHAKNIINPGLERADVREILITN